MIFQKNHIDLSKFINFFQIINNKKVNNLNIFTVMISKEKTIANLISLKSYDVLFILEGNLNMF